MRVKREFRKTTRYKSTTQKDDRKFKLEHSVVGHIKLDFGFFPLSFIRRGRNFKVVGPLLSCDIFQIDLG